MKKILIGFVTITILGLAAFFLFRNTESEVNFRTEKVVRGDIVATVTATGTVNAVTTVLVGTQVSGTIKNIYVDFNSPVKKGQLIALIDPSTLEAQVAQARANLLSAKANVEKAEATLVDAKRTMDRNRNLLSKNLIARSDLETAETNYETAKAQVGVSKAQVAQTEAALKITETNIGYTKILSPVDGVVISRNVDIGQTVAASFQTPTLFTIAQDLTKMQIDTSVDEADIGKIITGQDVEFTVDAYPDITFKGAVSQIRNAPITVQNVVTYDVVIKVDNPIGANSLSPLLKPGMTANVSIILSVKRNVLMIPNAALRFVPVDKEKGRTRLKGHAVWIIKDNKPERMPVSTGNSDGNNTELVSVEIKEGQEIIVETILKPNEIKRPVGPRMF
jgi:HlyD family secretion protein